MTAIHKNHKVAPMYAYMDTKKFYVYDVVYIYKL